jgi:hypothetical protein
LQESNATNSNKPQLIEPIMALINNLLDGNRTGDVLADSMKGFMNMNETTYNPIFSADQGSLTSAIIEVIVLLIAGQFGDAGVIIFGILAVFAFFNVFIFSFTGEIPILCFFGLCDKNPPMQQQQSNATQITNDRILEPILSLINTLFDSNMTEDSFSDALHEFMSSNATTHGPINAQQTGIELAIMTVIGYLVAGQYGYAIRGTIAILVALLLNFGFISLFSRQQTNATKSITKDQISESINSLIADESTSALVTAILNLIFGSDGTTTASTLKSDFDDASSTTNTSATTTATTSTTIDREKVADTAINMDKAKPTKKLRGGDSGSL